MNTPKQIAEKIERVKYSISEAYPRVLLSMLNQQKKSIHRRTERGISVDGVPFKPYSENYKRYKLAVRGNLDWLRLRDEMMESFIGELTSRRNAVLRMGGSGSSSRYFNEEKARKNNATRPFFAVSDSEREARLDFFKAYIWRIVQDVFK